MIAHIGTEVARTEVVACVYKARVSLLSQGAKHGCPVIYIDSIGIGCANARRNALEKIIKGVKPSCYAYIFIGHECKLLRCSLKPFPFN